VPRRADEYVTEAGLDARTAAWLADVRAAVVPRPHLAIDPAACALLVIDPIAYFLSPAEHGFLPASRAVVPRIARLVAAWREAGRPVVFARHGHAGGGDEGALGRFSAGVLAASDPRTRIDARLEPLPGEPVIRKATYDAFAGTDLEARLRAAGATQVLVAGVLAHLCCETTARSAFCRGFDVVVAADALATTTERLHAGTLLALADGFGLVLSTEEVLCRCAMRRS
jgi:nicotinamidase-related amidase